MMMTHKILSNSISANDLKMNIKFLNPFLLIDYGDTP